MEDTTLEERASEFFEQDSSERSSLGLFSDWGLWKDTVAGSSREVGCSEVLEHDDDDVDKEDAHLGVC